MFLVVSKATGEILGQYPVISSYQYNMIRVPAGSGTLTIIFSEEIIVTKVTSYTDVDNCSICGKPLNKSGICPHQDDHDRDVVASVKTKLTWNLIRNQNILQEEVMTDLSLIDGLDGTTIFWSSTNTSVVDTDGNVTRASFTDGDKNVTVTANIVKGMALDEKEFDLTIQKLAATDAEAVSVTKAYLTWDLIRLLNEEKEDVKTDLNLLTTGLQGATIAWQSEIPLVIAPGTGVVTRQSYIDGNKPVTLYATIKRGDEEDHVEFELVVTKLAITHAEQVILDKAWLTWDGIKDLNEEQDAVTLDLVVPLPLVGPNGSTIAWSSDKPAALSDDGSVTRPSFNATNATLTLRAVIRAGVVPTDFSEDLVEFQIVVLKATNRTDAESVEADKDWLDWSKIKGENESIDDVIYDLVFPDEGPDGSDITWSIEPDDTIINDDGTVTRPEWDEGDAEITVIATIKKGDEIDTKEFVITVRKLEKLFTVTMAADTNGSSAITAMNSTDDDQRIDETNKKASKGVEIAIEGTPTDGHNYRFSHWELTAGPGITLVDVTDDDADDNPLTFTMPFSDVTFKAIFVKIPRCPVCDTELVNGVCPNQHEHDIDDVETAVALVTWDKIRKDNTLQEEVRTDLDLLDEDELEFPEGVSILWTSTDTDVLDDTDGTVTRPSYAEGDAELILTAEIIAGEVTDYVIFPITVLLLPTDEEAVELIMAELTWDVIRGDNTLQSEVTTDLNLVEEYPWDTD